MNALPTFIEPERLARIRDLELLARTVVEGVMAGIHRGPKTGTSIDFAQYRFYSQGDDLRFLDWKLYGRTDRLYLKQYQEETNLRATLILDCSASMGYASGAVSKFQYARMLCACLALIMKRQGDAVGLLAYRRGPLLHLPPGRTARHHPGLMAELARLEADEATDTPATLRYLGDVLPPRGLVVLITDCLYPLEEMVTHLRSLRARRHDVLLFQISDRAERDFPFDKAVTLLDAEDDRECFVVPDAVRQAYLENRKTHFNALRKACLEAEIDCLELFSDEPLDRALRHFLERRASLLLMGGRRSARVGKR